jgi:hypothetical protein
VQARGRTSDKARQPLVIPQWLRGVALAFIATVLLEAASADFIGFPRAALLFALYVLVLAAAADTVWCVWTSRKAAAIAALTGTSETVPAYSEQVRMWVSGITLALAGGVTLLHGGEALAILRAWAQLHRWAPPQIAVKLIPPTIGAHQPFQATVTVDKRAADRYRCEWQGPIAEWAADSACDIRRTPPQHFVDPEWPTRRIVIGARVFDGDRLLGLAPNQTLTINYAPIIDLVADKARIIQGQRAEFQIRVDGHPPGPDDHCRWTVRGELVCCVSFWFLLMVFFLVIVGSGSVLVRL